ncbi:threonine synthase [Lapillicoccus jejuensis]|uniref:Threonine synthase n=1 Tax=Lapillicoccus jejuensis TaxID=402171 RepID=A0A542DWM5_9MICO|nr:threonine synthase [Lapillicoccus jejuensis]TQJ07493.1 threonine synthase [Lapillicoccus jejuensis]
MPTPPPTSRTPAADGADGAPYSALSHLECPRCGRQLDAHVLQGLCPCGSPLLVRYDLAGLVRASYAPSALAGRAPDLWRYHEVLPVQSPGAVVTLGEGMTPLLPLPRVGERVGVRRLLVKDEGLLPTGSFKARGAAVGVSRAAELGATALSMPTNGNAGAAWAAYAARAGLPLHVAMPLDAPSVTRVEVTATGARLTLVDGHIGEAGGWLARHRPEGVTDVSTLKEPYRIEGKKTMALEVAEQLGWRMPDVVVYPTGGGVGLIGMHKAFHELLELGWVTGDVPRFVAVQSTGCAPVVEAFDAGAEQVRPWAAPRTVAFGITVPAPLGDRLVLHALRDSGGTAVAVDDAELLADLRLVGELEGLFASPEGAATVSAVRRLRASGWLGEDDEVLVLNTGSGLVYPDTVPVAAPTVAPGD